MSFATRAIATSPGSIGNLGPGLDVLGAAVHGAYDSVEATWCYPHGVTVLDPGHPSLPTHPEQHASAIAALAVIDEAHYRGVELGNRGIALRVTKGLPLAGGQGGSAASAVAGACAASALLGLNLDQTRLIACALAAERVVAGPHLDNIVPSLLGGICLVRSLEPIDVVRLPTPDRIRVVLAHPNQQLRTADSRAVLPETVTRTVALEQMANVAAMVAACANGDLALLGRAMHDQIAEPARAHLIPGFETAKTAALEAGALGASISGSGPTMFALCDSDVSAQRVLHAVREAYEREHIEAQVRATRLDLAGTRTEAFS